MTFAACGPDPRPEEPCNGPSFNLVVRTEKQPLPEDTRINVRYGANPEGEPYTLGEKGSPQAVRCTEDSSPGGAPSDAGEAEGGDGGSGGSGGGGPGGVWALRCLLYTQGPARLDVTASGYETIDDRALSLDRKHRCDVDVDITLEPQQLDAGM